MKKDLTGLSFQYFKVLKKSGRTKNGTQLYACECLHCGGIANRRAYDLSKGLTKSCGCLRDEMYRIGTRLKHGFTSKQRTKDTIYSRLQCILDRCYNPNRRAYQNYGARGITVWEHWESMEYVVPFRNYILELYPDALELFAQGYQIDRIDNDSGYQPGNIRLVSGQINGRNKRNSQKYGGTSVYDLYERCPKPAVGIDAFRSRLKRGWSLDCALKRPLHHKRKKDVVPCSDVSCWVCYFKRSP